MSPTGAEPRTLAPFGRRLARVVANDAVGAYRVVSAADPHGPADPRPGQFYMLAAASRWGAGEGERPYLPRAFSHCRVRPGGVEAPAEVRGDGHGAGEDGHRAGEDGHGAVGGPVLSFLLEDVGPGTERLAALAPREGLWLVGPLGLGFRLPPPGGGRTLLVGGGVGTAPILCLQDELGPGARTLLGFRSGEHAAAARFFSGEPVLATDDGSVGRRALVTELLREELDRDAEVTVYACGPPPMLEGVRALCAEREVPAQLALESGMACGYGACFGCVVPTRSGYLRLCLDGPVLDAAELETALGPGVAP